MKALLVCNFRIPATSVSSSFADIKVISPHSASSLSLGILKFRHKNYFPDSLLENINTMLYLLLGDDDYSKREFINKLADEKKLLVESVPVSANFPAVRDMLAPGLFEHRKIFLFQDRTGEILQNNLVFFKNTSQYAVFLEKKLDKRKADAQKLIKDKGIIVKDFNVPTAHALAVWVRRRMEFLGGKISEDGLKTLIEHITEGETTRFSNKEPSYSLWQVDNELKKLLAYSGEAEIGAETVSALVVSTNATESWDIVNALADRQTHLVYERMRKFFAKQDSDEKIKIIQLTASLAEQFRSILMVRDFADKNLSDSAILKLTGWKSGRLFIVKKLAKKFSKSKVRNFLDKLVSLDAELKSSNLPPRILLEVIYVQILQ